MNLKYLPQVSNNSDGIPDSTEVSERTPETVGVYPCLCCGYKTLPVPAVEAIAYICPVCFWENDVFISSDDEPSDENHGMSLNEARENFKKYKASRKEFCSKVREPLESEMVK